MTGHDGAAGRSVERLRDRALAALAVGAIAAVFGGLVAGWSAMLSLAMMDADRAARAGEFAFIHLGWDLGRAALVAGALIVAVAAMAATGATLVLRRHRTAA